MQRSWVRRSWPDRGAAWPELRKYIDVYSPRPGSHCDVCLVKFTQVAEWRVGWRCEGRTEPSSSEPGEGEVAVFIVLRTQFPTLSEAGKGSWKSWAGRARRPTKEGSREPAHRGLISTPVPQSGLRLGTAGWGGA